MPFIMSSSNYQRLTDTSEADLIFAEDGPSTGRVLFCKHFLSDDFFCNGIQRLGHKKNEASLFTEGALAKVATPIAVWVGEDLCRMFNIDNLKVESIYAAYSDKIINFMATLIRNGIAKLKDLPPQHKVIMKDYKVELVKEEDEFYLKIDIQSFVVEYLLDNSMPASSMKRIEMREPVKVLFQLSAGRDGTPGFKFIKYETESDLIVRLALREEFSFNEFIQLCDSEILDEDLDKMVLQSTRLSAQTDSRLQINQLLESANVYKNHLFEVANGEVRSLIIRLSEEQDKVLANGKDLLSSNAEQQYIAKTIDAVGDIFVDKLEVALRIFVGESPVDLRSDMLGLRFKHLNAELKRIDPSWGGKTKEQYEDDVVRRFDVYLNACPRLKLVARKYMALKVLIDCLQDRELDAVSKLALFKKIQRAQVDSILTSSSDVLPGVKIVKNSNRTKSNVAVSVGTLGLGFLSKAIRSKVSDGHFSFWKSHRKTFAEKVDTILKMSM